MFLVILKLFLVSLIAVASAIGLRLIDKKTNYLKNNLILKQIIAGAIFGIISILGTVFGVVTKNGAIINVRDSAPIISGLVFGGPSGIIAGAIGGGYRFVSVYFGGSGSYTQIACAVSTLMSGVFTAIVRKLIFDGHHGKWYYGGLLALLCEDFHMIMVFLTHMNDIANAYEVVKACFIPMILVNSVAVMIALIGVALVSNESLIEHKKPKSIRLIIQTGLALALLLAYLSISTFSYFSLKNTSLSSTLTLLETSVNDTVSEIDDSVDRELLDYTERSKEYIDNNINTISVDSIIMYLMVSYDFYEVNFIDNTNHIIKSSNPSYEPNEDNPYGFDMSSGSQSNEFSVLLGEAEYYIQDYQPITLDSNIYRKYSGIKLNDNIYDYAYVQFGYDGESYNEIMTNKISHVTNNRHIGDDGYLFVYNENGDIVSQNVEGIGHKIDNINNIKLNELTVYKDEEIGDVEYYYYCDYQEGFYTIAIELKDAADIDSNVAILALSLTEVFVFIILYFLIYISIKRNVVDKIINVNKSLDNISSGNLDVLVQENQTYEFKSLSDDINQTVNTLKGYIEKESKKMEEELRLAREIQASALPTTFPICKEFDIYASMDSAKDVGGDFYDFYYVDDKHFAIEIADVSGKGVPAAMFMMQSKQIIRGLIESGASVASAFTEANKKLCENNDAQMFVTSWLGIIDLETGIINFCNAGHNPPVFRHGNGSFEYLVSKAGFVLAGMDMIKYKEQTYKLLPGDEIYLYTDGVTEAMNNNQELFGEKRLLESLNKCLLLNAKDTCIKIKQDVFDFATGAMQADDITMLSFKYNGLNNNHFVIIKEANIANIKIITDEVIDYLKKNNIDNKTINELSIVIDEIVSNISNYGYKDIKGNLKVELEITNQEIKISFVDEGIEYNPLEKKDPDITLDASKRELGGLGIFIVKKTMDDLHYEYKNGYNVLTVSKKIRQ